MAFGNTVWANPANPPANHHGEIDYERAAAMGFNRVRFYFNYGIFEDDAAPYAYKQSGFDWIDQNIAWAKAHGITLIVNMHCPRETSSPTAREMPCGIFRPTDNGSSLSGRRSPAVMRTNRRSSAGIFSTNRS